MEKYAVGHGTLRGSNALSHGALESKGFGPEQIEAIEQDNLYKHGTLHLFSHT
jgi:hypothetical protein